MPDPILRVAAAVALLTGASGCTVLDFSCTDLDDIEIIDDVSEDDGARVDLIRQGVAEFGSWTGRGCLALDEIEVVEAIDMPLWHDVDPVGLHEPLARRIQIEVRTDDGLMRGTVRHELCHALDRVEAITRDDEALWTPDASTAPEGYAKSSWAAETFARACGRGPRPAVERALVEAYGLQLEPRAAFVEHEVFVHPPALEEPLRFDLDLSVERETLSVEPGRVFRRWTALGERLAVLTTDSSLGGAELQVYDLDPLRLVASHDLPAAPAAWDRLWAGADEVAVGSEDGHWMFASVQGVTSGPLALGEVGVLGDEGVVLDGVGIGHDLEGRTVGVDLRTGEPVVTGLTPSTYFAHAWVEQGDVALWDFEGTTRGNLQDGWWFDAAPAWDRSTQVGHVWLGWHGVPTLDGHVSVAVAQDADGVDHYPPELVELAGEVRHLGGRARLLRHMPADGGLHVLTPTVHE